MSGSDHRLPAEAWIGLLGDDPRRWLLEAGEPTARFIALTELLDWPAGDPDALAARCRPG